MTISTLAVDAASGVGFGVDADQGPSGTIRESGFWGNGRASRVHEASPYPRPVEDLSAPLAPKARKVAATSHAMRKVLELLQPLARADVAITLTGETGTGKDVLARTIHQASTRRGGPFVVFDCGAVASNLAESELLGHERGAFTGAVTAYAGAFERAHGGTLFLDEIGELPLDLQTRLLRLLGNSSVRRVGGSRDRPFDVRIVSATNRDLQAEVAAGRFRQDLYFRLAGAKIQVPALRDRAEDIPALAVCLLEDLGRPDVRIAPEALRLLAERRWRGNVRELKNTLACGLAFLDGVRLEARHLDVPSAFDPPDADPVDQLPLAGLRLDNLERAAIAQTLRLTAGNKIRAAESLGIAPSTLYEKLKRYQKPLTG